MEAGLAPGQVSQGLRLFGDFVPQVREFIACMGQDMVIAEPLAYNNAFVFEEYGLGYIRGMRKMSEINEGFQPGGELYERLDGSTSFRKPGMEKTVRGRSWTMHDGILGNHGGVSRYTEPINRLACVLPLDGFIEGYIDCL